jgi:hypothetical protein
MNPDRIIALKEKIQKITTTNKRRTNCNNKMKNCNKNCKNN